MPARKGYVDLWPAPGKPPALPAAFLLLPASTRSSSSASRPQRHPRPVRRLTRAAAHHPSSAPLVQPSPGATNLSQSALLPRNPL